MSDCLHTMETNNEITERIRVDYNDEELEDMEDQKVIVLTQIKRKQRDTSSIIYENQEKCSLSIVSSLQNRKIINIMITALTQSGKTGTMSALIKNYLNTNLIPMENIFIITGLSSREWIHQTKNRMPESIQKRVFHRNKLLKDEFVDDIKNKKNVLVIIDEIQIAAKEDQTLNKTFDKVGFYDRQNLFNNDIKIIEFTATPDGTIYDLMDWGENAEKIKMEPGEGYTSCFDLKNQNRVFQCKDLMVDDNVLELKKVIDNEEVPLYHIIRTPNGDKAKAVIDNLRKYYNPLPYYTYDKDSDIEDINKLLNEEPKEHTFIFIKEKMRCAKSLKKTYLGVLYERCTKTPDDAVIIQGLIGRGTGYDDNGKIKCFTNIESIEKYEKLWESNFEDKSIIWKSKTTTKNENNETTSKGTFNGMCEASNEEINEKLIKKHKEPVIKSFKSLEEAKEYFMNIIKPLRPSATGPQERKKNDEDYYLASIANLGYRVYSRVEVEKYKTYGLNNKKKTPYTCTPCYEDINDKSTLLWLMIHY